MLICPPLLILTLLRLVPSATSLTRPEPTEVMAPELEMVIESRLAATCTLFDISVVKTPAFFITTLPLIIKLSAPNEEPPEAERTSTSNPKSG